MNGWKNEKLQTFAALEEAIEGLLGDRYWLDLNDDLFGKYLDLVGDRYRAGVEVLRDPDALAEISAEAGDDDDRVEVAVSLARDLTTVNGGEDLESHLRVLRGLAERRREAFLTLRRGVVDPSEIGYLLVADVAGKTRGTGK